MRINNINIEKISIGAVVIGVGVLVKEQGGVVVTHRFNVELPDYVAQDVQDVLTKHFGNVNSMLKLRPNMPLGAQSKNVTHREMNGLKDPQST